MKSLSLHALIILSIVALGVQSLGAQTLTRTDSLLGVLSHYDSQNINRTSSLRDSVKVKILQKIVLQYIDSEPKLALKYSQQFLALSQRIKYEEGIADGHLFIGGIYNRLGSHDKAIVELKRSATLFLNTKDEASAAKAYAELGILFSKLGNFPEAIRYNLAALKVFEKQADGFAIASSQINIGILYKQHEDYTRALQYYNDAIRSTKKLATEDASYIRGYAYNSIGQVYIIQNKKDQALEMLQRARTITEHFNDDFQMADIDLSMGKIYLEEGRNQMAIAKINNALNLNLNNDAQPGVSECYLQLGRAYFELNQLTKAQAYTEKALTIAKTVKQKEFERDAYSRLAKISQVNKDYRSAYHYHIKFKQMNDSLFNEEQNKKLVEQQMNYEFGKKEALTAYNQQRKDAESIDMAAKQKAVNLTILAVLIIVTGLALWAFYNLRRIRRQRLVIETQKTALEKQNGIITESLTEKESLLREIHHRVKNNLQIISSLLNIQSEEIKDKEVLSSIQEGRSRVEAMSLIHQNLYQAENLNNVDIENYIRQLAQYLAQLYPSRIQPVVVNVNTGGIRFDIDTAIPLGLIVNELITNAYKYAFTPDSGGNINIDINASTTTDYVLKVTNDGEPFDPEFKLAESKSLGLKLVSILSRQLRGRFSFSCEDGITSFRVEFKDLKMFQLSN